MPLRPTTTIRPSVNVSCSRTWCGSLSHPAAWSLGTTNRRQVSASLAIGARRYASQARRNTLENMGTAGIGPLLTFEVRNAEPDSSWTNHSMDFSHRNVDETGRIPTSYAV